MHWETCEVVNDAAEDLDIDQLNWDIAAQMKSLTFSLVLQEAKVLTTACL